MVHGLVEDYNQKILKDVGLNLKVKEVLFYGEYRMKYKKLAGCAGRSDMRCRVRNNSVKNTTLLFISTRKGAVTSDLESHMRIKACQGRYYANIFNEDLFGVTANALNEFLSNLLEQKVPDLTDTKRRRKKGLRLKAGKMDEIFEECRKTKRVRKFKNYSKKEQSISSDETSSKVENNKTEKKLQEVRRELKIDKTKWGEVEPWKFNQKSLKQKEVPHLQPTNYIIKQPGPAQKYATTIKKVEDDEVESDETDVPE
ncbi:hypothetical protein ECANGB1_2223 [Enterospora canceri]|uniref:Uncharacterized protein n=1 Tax=Enterospora canceri TaxID=1081671 RepID=A0A1Y1S9G1_9MICR|nr:hypothetical protein ECANGB1_2223 [Enterospora canceri]